MANTKAVEPITFPGTNVTASMDAYIWHSIIGKDAVFKRGRDMEVEVVDNNNVRIRDGILSNQGRLLRIKPGQYENLIIDSGTQGKKRCDSIVAEYQTSGANETHQIKVIKGVAGTVEKKPTLTVEDLESGGSLRQFELHRVHIDGIHITDVERMPVLVSGFKNDVVFEGEIRASGEKRIDLKSFNKIRIYVQFHNRTMSIFEMDISRKSPAVLVDGYPYASSYQCASLDSPSRTFMISTLVSENKDRLKIHQISFRDKDTPPTDVPSTDPMYCIYRVEGIV